MIQMKVKTRSEIPKVIRKAKRAKIESITSGAAYVRTVVKRKIGRRKNPRSKGQAMTSPTGRARRSILFAADRRDPVSAIIGPTHRMVGRSVSAHEFGTKFKGDSIEERPSIGPGLEASAPKLAEFWRGSFKQ